MGFQTVEGRRFPTEGEHVFVMTSAKYDDDFDKVEIGFKDETGGTCRETFYFTKNSGEPNDVAREIFSTLVKCALHTTENVYVEWEELVGLAVGATAVKEPYKNKKGEDKVGTRLKYWQPVPEEELPKKAARRLEEILEVVNERLAEAAEDEDDEDDDW